MSPHGSIKINKDGYSIYFVREAMAELQKLLDEALDGSLTEEEMEFRLEQAFSRLAGAWHVRAMDDDRFENLSHDEINWIRRSIPNLSSMTSSPFKIVSKEASVDSNSDSD